MTARNPYKIPLILAIALHSLLFISLFLHFLPQLKLGQGPQVKIVNATLISDRAVESPLREQAKPTPPKATPKPVMQQPVALPPVTAKPEPVVNKQAEQQAQQKLAEEKQAAAEQLQAQQAKAVAAEKAAEIAAAKKVVLAKKQAAQAVAKKAQAQKKMQQQKQLKQQLQADQQQLIQQQMAQEQKQLSAASAAIANNQKMQSEIDKYRALIISTISQNWLVPSGLDKSLSCQLLIKLAPGGAVLDVEVVKSSGNDGLDQSAITAVYKSTPLPVPSDPELFDKFRQLRLTVKPEKIED